MSRRSKMKFQGWCKRTQRYATNKTLKQLLENNGYLIFYPEEDREEKKDELQAEFLAMSESGEMYAMIKIENPELTEEDY
jgi:hypothetical protein